MKYIKAWVAAMGLSLLTSVGHAGEIDDYSRTIELFRQSPQVQLFFDSAYGYAVYPRVGKGAWILGFTYAKGQVYRGGYVTGRSTLYHVSIGLQGGGQVYSQIIFFQDQRAYDEFTQGTFEVDAATAAVAVTAGARAQTGTTGSTASTSSGPQTATQFGNRYAKGLAIFVQGKGGLMLDASVGAQRFTFEPLTTPVAGLDQYFTPLAPTALIVPSVNGGGEGDGWLQAASAQSEGVEALPAGGR